MPHVTDLIQSRNLADFIPVLQSLPELGEPFYLAMLRWCGIGVPDEDLRFWEVYLLRRDNEICGVSGLYQRQQADPDDVWLGWFGVSDVIRDRGLGTKLLHLTLSEAKSLEYGRVLVHCNFGATAAQAFCMANGFQIKGPAVDEAPGMTPRPDDVVLECSLDAL